MGDLSLGFEFLAALLTLLYIVKLLLDRTPLHLWGWMGLADSDISCSPWGMNLTKRSLLNQHVYRRG